MRRAALLALAMMVQSAVSFAGQWDVVTVANPPAPRGAYSMAILGHYLYLYGGYNLQQTFNDLWRLDLTSQPLTWELLGGGAAAAAGPDPWLTPAGRTGTQMTVETDRINVGGGFDANNNASREFGTFDPDQGTWDIGSLGSDQPAVGGARGAPLDVIDGVVVSTGGTKDNYFGDPSDLLQIIDLNRTAATYFFNTERPIRKHVFFLFDELGKGVILFGDIGTELNSEEIYILGFDTINAGGVALNMTTHRSSFSNPQGRTSPAYAVVPHSGSAIIAGGLTATGRTRQTLQYTIGQGFRQVEDASDGRSLRDAAVWPRDNFVNPLPPVSQRDESPGTAGTADDRGSSGRRSRLQRSATGMAATQNASGLTGKVPRAVFLTFGGWDGTAFHNDLLAYETNIPVPGEGPDHTLPTVAHVTGRGGVFFTSRVDLVNAGSGAMEVEVTYTPRKDLGGAALATTLTLQPGIQLTVDDPLAAWFGLGSADVGVGSLIFRVTQGSPLNLLVQSVVLGRNPDGSEYGQFLGSVATVNALLPGLPAYFPTTNDTARNRVNFGAVGLEDGTEVGVQLVDPVGSGLSSEKTYTLDQGQSVQLNDVFATFAVAPHDNALIKYRTISGWALGYGSVLDGNGSYVGTSDPTTVLGVFGGSYRVTFLEVGPVNGLNEFSGSASVTNYAGVAATVKADFYERGTPGVASTATFGIPAYGTVGFDDLVGDIFGLVNKVGTVVLTPQTSTPIGGTAREFAVFRNGQGQVVGTAGQRMAGLTDGRRLQPWGTYHFLGLRQTGTATGSERTHLAAFNPGSADATLTAMLYDGATGAAEGELSWTVRAGELKQINFVLGVIKPGIDAGPKRLVVTVSDAMFVNAFRINKDGDPVTIDAFFQ